MSDLISRAEAIAAMLKEQDDDIEAYGCAIMEGFDGDRAVRVLKQLPTINIYDVMYEYSDRLWKLAYERGKREGIIRCKDCMWYFSDQELCGLSEDFFPTPDDFCSKGKRRMINNGKK